MESVAKEVRPGSATWEVPCGKCHVGSAMREVPCGKCGKCHVGSAVREVPCGKCGKGSAAKEVQLGSVAKEVWRRKCGVERATYEEDAIRKASPLICYKSTTIFFS